MDTLFFFFFFLPLPCHSLQPVMDNTTGLALTPATPLLEPPYVIAVSAALDRGTYTDNITFVAEVCFSLSVLGGLVFFAFLCDSNQPQTTRRR